MPPKANGEPKWFWDGYLDWSRELAGFRTIIGDPQQPEYVPVFLRLKPEHSGFDADSVFRLFDDQLSRFEAKFERHEREYVKRSNSEEIEFFAYLLLKTLEEDDSRSLLEGFFLILDLGSAVVLGTKFAGRDFSIPPTAVSVPLIAVIDDGIAFLNERFTRYHSQSSTRETRFAGVWVQARERPAPDGSTVMLGRTLDANEINGFLAKGPTLNELEEYQTLNAGLYGPRSRRSTEYAFSHGTHVLDVAAGADPYSDSAGIDMWPLLAVQLPPESIEDTSGRRFETHVVMGLRWILWVASGAQPLVINISLGILAGPKNGRKFFEYQTTREVLHWRNLTNQDVRVVFAFGNSFRTRQVARYRSLARNSPTSIDWVVQPDDFTPSFIEIHVIGRDHLPTTLAVGLTASDGTVLNLGVIAPGHFVTMLDAGTGFPVARIYHVPSRILQAAPSTAGNPIRTVANYTIAIAPTAAQEPAELTAPSGTWEVQLKHQETQPLDVVMQIQRDDTAPGYEPLGRQSYFDHHDAHEWDCETLDFSNPASGCPITRDGTNNALATGRAYDQDGHELVLTAGGAVWRSREEAPRAAHYTSKGADWSGGPPTHGAISEDGYALEGVLASGTLSGSVQELTGTSSAAPKIARRLAQELTGVDRPHAPGDTHLAIADQEGIRRLSADVLIERGGARAR